MVEPETIALVVFVVLPLAFCLWAFVLSCREKGDVSLPNGDATDTPAMLRNCRRANWRLK